MYVCDGTKFTFSRSYRKAWKHKRQKERIHHHHCTWMKNKSNHRQSLSLSHTYSVSFPSLSSPVWSFSWSLSAATTGSPSRPGDPPETPCRRRGSNESDSNLKQHSHHISYHINSIQVLEQCTYVSPLRNAWKTLSTSSGCMDQIAPPPLLGDRCILGDLPPAPALERMELRTEDDLKSGTSTKTE